jgi:hypothetical protein
LGFLLSGAAFASPSINSVKAEQVSDDSEEMALSEGTPVTTEEDASLPSEEKLSLKSEDVIPSPIQSERMEDRNNRY